MMDGIAYLISQTYVTDEIGRQIPKESKTEIFVTEDSITRSEWNAAGRDGLKPALMLKTSACNYSGEKIVEYNNVRYGIYRTYEKKETDEIELYLEWKAGYE